MIAFFSALFLGAGLFFILSAVVALFRFPDLYTRLHAVTKADNVGLGLIILSLIIQEGSWWGALKLGLIWFFMLLASAVSSYLIANTSLRQPIKPWEKESGGDGF